MQDSTSPTQGTAWYRLPVVWLGIVVFAASLAGCAWIIVASVRYADEPLPLAGHAVLGVPAHARPAQASSS